VDRIHVAEVRDRWWAVVSTVMNVQIYKKLAGSWLAEQLLSFEDNYTSWSYLICLLLGLFIGWLCSWLANELVL
jgi:hypothetical protein